MDSDIKRILQEDREQRSRRISKVRDIYCHGSNLEFAAKLHRDPTYTSQLCTGSKTAGYRILSEMLVAFPKVNKEWLLWGRGDMAANTPNKKDDSANGAGYWEMMYRSAESKLREKDIEIKTLLFTIQELKDIIVKTQKEEETK